MKVSSSATLLTVVSLLGSLGFIGCGGAMNVPDTVMPSQVNGPAIKGSAFGGHAPIAGMHVYLLQPGTTGYGSAANSILGNNGVSSATDGAPYSLATDVNDPNVPTKTPSSDNPKYVTTNSQGEFDLTGLYSCTANEPVYIYAFGGSPLSPAYTGGYTTTTTAEDPITNIMVGKVTTGISGGRFTYTATYTVTVSVPVTIAANGTVTIGGLTGTSNGYDFEILNNTSPAVTAAVTGSYTFMFSATTTSEIDQGTYSTSGTHNFGTGGYAMAPEVTTTTNPIVELATLGNCPSSGNFSGSTGYINYIYMNEVSTVATAYTFAPFTSISATSNTAWNIGTPGSTFALAGIENAANNAGQLYDIQGRGGATATSPSAGEGEGHIANLTTPLTLGGKPNTGNGTVPQETVDTLANILAACLDSTLGTNDGLSSSCTTLFSTATSTGTSTGTNPTDIATAAINIANYPAGNNSGTSTTYVNSLYTLQGSVVPYAPDLANQPNDFTLTIGYGNTSTYTGIGETNGTSPHSIAVDASGYIYAVNYSGSELNILTPLGAPVLAITESGYLASPVSVAIDLSGNAWVANYGSDYVTEFYGENQTPSQVKAPGVEVGHYSVPSLARDAEIDGSGNIWVTTNDSSSLLKLSSTTGAVSETATTNLDNPFGVAIEEGAAGNVWVANSAADYASLFTNADAAVDANGKDEYSGNTGGDVDDPIGVAIDSTGNAWFADSNGKVSELTSAGVKIAGSPVDPSSSSTAANDGIAIDGGGNVWVTNPTGGTIYELSNAGALISPSNGYSAALGSPDGVAIDSAGNLWYTSSSTDDVYEVIGAAAPVVTPLSSAVKNNRLGAEPTATVP